MKQIILPYLEFPTQDPVTKEKGVLYRPVIRIYLSFEKRGYNFFALIDSGADYCLFPAWIATALGHRLEKGQERTFNGVGGSIKAYLHTTFIQIQDYQFRCDCFYSRHISDYAYGLLGQVGLFSYFREIRLDYEHKQITIIIPATTPPSSRN